MSKSLIVCLKVSDQSNSSVKPQCAITVCRFAMGGLFSTNVYAENRTSFKHKIVCGERNPAYCKCAVICRFVLRLKVQ